jgi:SAM-dependent methyltransferase
MRVLKLYAGDITGNNLNYDGYLGLSLTQNNENHIKCDLTQLPLPFDDNSVDAFQSEDVFEHINYDKLIDIINDIYRILKPNSLFRLSMPDYHCDILYKRSIYDFNGNIVYDPGGGGTFENPGHVWFPNYDNVKTLLENTLFKNDGRIEYLHYWNNRENSVVKNIDYSKGYIKRTPDHDERVKKPYRPMSIVIDLYKGN